MRRQKISMSFRFTNAHSSSRLPSTSGSRRPVLWTQARQAPSTPGYIFKTLLDRRKVSCPKHQYQRPAHRLPQQRSLPTYPCPEKLRSSGMSACPPHLRPVHLLLCRLAHSHHMILGVSVLMLIMALYPLPQGLLGSANGRCPHHVLYNGQAQV